MSKRAFWVSLLLVVLLFSSCSNKKDEIQVPVNFYYANKDIIYNSSHGVIRPEVREGVHLQGDLNAVLCNYLQGPVSQELKQLVPDDVKVLSCSVVDNQAYIIFSDEFSKLTDVSLSKACSALLMTVHDCLGIDTIQVSVDGVQLNEKDNIMITIDEVVWMDDVLVTKNKME